LLMASIGGNLDIVRCLIIEFSADVNKATGHEGLTPLMCGSYVNNHPLIKHLVRKVAHVSAVMTKMLAAAGANAAQIAYLEVRECCANPGCDGGGRKRCCVCKVTCYCGMACRVAHWRVHRGGCRPPTNE
jgi:hypothetical protein